MSPRRRRTATPPELWGSLGGIDHLLAQCPNVYADLSAKSALNAFIRDARRAGLFVSRHRRKLLFGTDRFVRQEEPAMMDVLRDMALLAEMVEVILWGNAPRLLMLD